MPQRGTGRDIKRYQGGIEGHAPGGLRRDQRALAPGPASAAVFGRATEKGAGKSRRLSHWSDPCGGTEPINSPNWMDQEQLARDTRTTAPLVWRR